MLANPEILLIIPYLGHGHTPANPMIYHRPPGGLRSNQAWPSKLIRAVRTGKTAYYGHTHAANKPCREAPASKSRLHLACLSQARIAPWPRLAISRPCFDCGPAAFGMFWPECGRHVKRGQETARDLAIISWPRFGQVSQAACFADKWATRTERRVSELSLLRLHA